MSELFGGKFLLGVNYWSRVGGPRMWDRFDAERVRAELEQMRAIGLDACRMFAFVPSMMPAPPAVAAAPIAHLRTFGRLAAEAGVGLLPTPLVGHMSGENFGFAGQGSRSLYADADLVAWQRALVEAVVGALGDSPAVLGWVLTNEMPLWAGPGDPAAIEAWCRVLVDAVRARDPRPISTGDGGMQGFPTRRLAPHLDWVAPHVYHGDLDPLRQAYATDFALRALAGAGRPVLLEEFGGSSTQVAESEQAAQWREAIFAALGCGARGVLGWCFSDFDPETLGRETPYSHHGFELGFGITRADGTEKPVCDELRAARRLLDASDLAAARPRPPRAAIVRPRWLDESFPFSWDERAPLAQALLQAFVLAAQAGLDPAVIGEDDDFAPYALLLCPSTQKLTTPTWLKLRDAARAGATVYWSYYSGDYTFHQGTWCPIFEQLTGLRHRLRYGSFDLPPDRLTLKGPFHLSLPTGVAHAANPAPLSRLPTEIPTGAPVRTLALDGDGRPALTAHELGAGRVIFLAWPLERYLAALPDGSARDAHRLYRLLADEADLEEPYPTHHPDVQSRVLDAGADQIVIVQHRGWTARVDDASDVPRDADLLYERGCDGAAFGPKAVRIYRVRAA